MTAKSTSAAPELRRIRWLLRAAVLWAVVIFGKLVYLQIYQHDQLMKVARNRQEDDIPINAPRGNIRDRHGYDLAISTKSWTVIVNPRKLNASEEALAAAVLARTLHLDAPKISALLTEAREKNRGYLKIKNRVDATEYNALKAWVEEFNAKTTEMTDDVEWLGFQQESWRAYPHNELAAPLIGAVDAEENGNAGLEQVLQNDLGGKPGQARILTDSLGRHVDTLDFVEPVPGKNVYLTIDAQLQFLADRELANAVRSEGFTTGSLVAMNPVTGEIYAMSAYPSFNPNEPPKKGQLGRRVHLAVSQALDGGSVMKMMTIAAALRHTRLRPHSLVETGEFRYADQRIQDTHSLGLVSLEKVLWISSNGGAIRAAVEVGRDNLWKTLHDAGFGQKTGIQLPWESAGVLNALKKWQYSSLYYVAIGHEMAVTTIQLAQACSIFANGGYRVQPKLIVSKQADGGPVEVMPESPKVRVMEASTAIDMRKMSEGVVLYGTGKRARIAGRTVGGKTGTAQLYDHKTRRYLKLYSSSFMGYVPLGAPKVVVVVTLNGGRKYGGESAAPVFATVAEAALQMLGEPADVPQAAAPDKSSAAEDGVQMKLATHSAPAAVEEVPQPAATNEVLTGAAVPNFVGLDKRGVMRTSAETGVPVRMSGAGLVRSQTPAPGSVLPPGEPVRLRFQP